MSLEALMTDRTDPWVWFSDDIKRVWLRACVLNTRTTAEDLRALLDAIRRAASD
jgi:hypothetical protein